MLLVRAVYILGPLHLVEGSGGQAQARRNPDFGVQVQNFPFLTDKIRIGPENRATQAKTLKVLIPLLVFFLIFAVGKCLHNLPARGSRNRAIAATFLPSNYDVRTCASSLAAVNKGYHDTDSFGRDDLPLVAKLADQAHTFIFERLAELKIKPSE